MKKTIELLIVLLTSAAIFTLSKFLNTIQSFSISLLGTIILYFFSGLILKTYFNEKWIVFAFVLTSLFLYITIFLSGRPNLFVEFSLLGFMAASFAGGYLFRKFIGFSIISIGSILGTAMLFIFYLYPNQTVSVLNIQSDKLIGRKLAEDFRTVSLINKENLQLELGQRFKDSVVLLEFYFSNCKPCKLKAPVLNNIQRELSNEKFRIIFINDGRIDKIEKFKENATDSAFSLYDIQGKLSQTLGVESYPFEILIDKNGIIRNVSEGYGSGIDDEYKEATFQKIKELLNE